MGDRHTVNKHREKAVALRYKPDSDEAPVVVASGYGEMAERIIGVAEKQGIPVFRDDSAASLLCMLDVGKSIPPELYEVVSTIYIEILKVAKESQDKAKINQISANTTRSARAKRQR